MFCLVQREWSRLNTGMAAYGGLVSLINLVEEAKLYNGLNPIFDSQQLETLQGTAVSLQMFLEIYSNGGRSEGEVLESQIVDAVYAAEDLIESHIVDDIRARSTSTVERDSDDIHLRSTTTGERDLDDHFFKGIHKVIKCMDDIQRAAREIEDNIRVVGKKPQILRSAGSYEQKTMTNEDTTVMFDNTLMDQMKRKLTRGVSNLEIIPITGMGGIGKTTLARSIYDSINIKQHFSLRGWITVSQEFDPREILFGLLCDMGVLGNQSGNENVKYHELGDILHKYLKDRRYLIVTDDIWNLDAWDKVKRFLPDDGQGSRVIITTRDLDLANTICSANTRTMNLLTDIESWNLLKRKVFGKGNCPSELVEIGERIARNCKGLPLSIVVIGGVLAEFIDLDFWDDVAEDITGRVNSQEGERYFQILHTSYHFLPIHLKPCFLYLGVFKEDHSIRVSQLKKFWVAEGFLKPNGDKIMEEVADDYLKYLIGRSLLNVDRTGSTGNIKHCKIHDLLRDLCLREAKRQRFLHVTKEHRPNISEGLNSQRRVVLQTGKPEELYSPQLDQDVESSPLIRSLICNVQSSSKPSFNIKLLRVWSLEKSYRSKVFPELLNSRYLDFGYGGKSHVFPISVCLLWNLQTLKLGLLDTTILPSEMWEMSRLRHVKIEIFELDDPRGGKSHGGDRIVLKYLQTLSKVLDFRCSKAVLGMIPNLRKLKVSYHDNMLPPEYLQNLGHLTKLESLYCRFGYHFSDAVISNLKFAESLRKLTLLVREFDWEVMGSKIGSLRYLEKFNLYSFEGEEWNLVDGYFPSLKYLYIAIETLKCWTTDGTPFPRLEHLRLERMENLEEIPEEIGETPSLKSIYLYDCSISAVESAKVILADKRDCCNYDFVLNIY